MSPNTELNTVSHVPVPDIEKLFELDPYLRTHETEIRRRYNEFHILKTSIDNSEG